MSLQKKSEAYVRSKIPELMELSFGCEFEMRNSLWKRGLLCRVNDEGTCAPIGDSDGGTYELRHLGECEDEGCRIHKILGHPIQLQHWLRVLPYNNEDSWLELDSGKTLGARIGYGIEKEPTDWINFNLTTGQPATEENYQNFCKIVGI